MTVKLPAVQTYIIQKLTDAVYENLHIKVNIGSVSYAFFNRLDVNEIYVEDLDGDTLLYVDKLRLSVSSIGITTGVIGLGSVRLTDGEFNLHNDTERGIVNIRQLVWRFAPPKSDSDTIPKPEKEKKSKLSLKIGNVILDNFRFTMKRTPMKEYNDSARINFSDLRVDSIYLNLDNILLRNDTLFFDISELHFIEKSGFKLNNLTANGYVASSQAMFRDVTIRDEYSDVKMGFFSLNFDDIKSFKYFADKVRMDGLFSDAGYVSFQSLGYFAPVLRQVNTSVVPKGFVTGTVANLKSDSLYMATLDRGVETLVRFRMTGLPLIDETIIHGDIDRLQANSLSANKLLGEIVGKDAQLLQPYISLLREVDFKGKFTGLYNDFVTTGRMKTGIGLLGVDALFTNSVQKGTTFKGRFSGLDFNVGTLLKSSLLDRATFDVTMEGVLADGRLSTSIDGSVALLELNDYPYQNINLAGRLETSSFDGMVTVNDPNFRLDFLGKVHNLQYADSIPVFDFTANIRHADLHKLNLDINRRDTVSMFKGLVESKFTGRTWSTSQGTIALNNAVYTDDKGETNIGNVLFSIEQAVRSYKMKLSSEYVDAIYDATASPANMFKDFNYYMAHYLPSVASDTTGIGDTQDNTYRIRIEAKKTGIITQIVMPELFIAEGSTADAKLENNRIALEAQSDKLYYGIYEAKNPKVKVEQGAHQIDVAVTAEELNNSRALFVRDVAISSIIKGDSVQSEVKYDNKTEVRNLMDFNIRTLFSRKENNGLLADFKINPSTWVINNIPWAISCGGVLLDSARVSIENFEVGYKEQRLSLHGAYSSSSRDTLSLYLNALSLSHFDDILQDQRIPYQLDGTISGRALLFEYENQPLFYANMRATEVGTNGGLLGDIRIRSIWSNELAQLRFSTAIMRGANTLFNARGSYTPKTSDLEFSIEADKLPVVHAEPFLVGAMSRLEGSLTGKFRLEGKPGGLTLTGNGSLNDAGLTVDYLNTHYKINGDFISDKEKISLINATAIDDEGNIATIRSAFASHSYFKRFQFNLDLRLADVKALNTSVYDNDMFYGKLYARGDVGISGPLSDLKFNIVARTSRNSVLYIPLTTAMASRASSELLTFYVPKDTIQTVSKEEQFFLSSNISNRSNTVKRTTNIDLTLNVEATRDAEINVIFDPRTNDVLKGSGSGGITINVNPGRDIFTVFGTYTIDRGSYTLFIPNLNFIKKDFTLDRGGIVDFNGDMANMRFNLSATYDKIARTTLFPIIPYDSQNQAKIKYPITCRVNISGTLNDMKIDPQIVLSNIDSDTEAKVQSVLNTDEKKLKQFLALLALNQFVPEETARQSGSVNSSTGSSAGLANLSEIVSSQLSAIFSELNLPIDFGVSYKTGVDGVSNEFDVDFSYQINDRIIARGNVGNNYNALGTESTVSGDFDIEYLWKPSITLRAFSRSNDPYSDELGKGRSRYGGAISYQNRFSTFKELWNSIFKSKKKREADAAEIRRKEEEKRRASADSVRKQ
jgi:hypothetical protein